MLVFGGVTVSHKLRKTVVQTGGVEAMCRISLGKIFFKGSNYSKSIALYSDQKTLKQVDFF